MKLAVCAAGTRCSDGSAGISLLYTIGGILVVIGIVLWGLGAVGRPVGGRKVWF